MASTSSTQGITDPNTYDPTPLPNTPLPNYFDVPVPSPDDMQEIKHHVFKCGAGGGYAMPKDYGFPLKEGNYTNTYVKCEDIYQDPQKFISSCPRPSPSGPYGGQPSPTGGWIAKEITVPVMPVHPTLGAGHLWAGDDTKAECIRNILRNPDTARVIFTPSYKRGASTRRSLEGRRDLGNTTVTVVVIHDMEKKEYEDVLDLKNTALLILPGGVLGIGATRNWILATAMCWGLQRCWMIDDNVEPGSLKYRTIGVLPIDLQPYETFLIALRHLENVMSNKSLSLLGPASEFSVKHLRSDPTIISHRAPTSFVLLDVALLRSKEIQYFNCLTQKEDIMLAYTCVKRGLQIGVDQRITFKKYDRTRGSTGAIQSGRDVYDNKRMADLTQAMAATKL